MTYYDRQGVAISRDEWARDFDNDKVKIVKQTRVDDVLVSTVWLGLDHRFSGEGPPLIFETMIFGGDHDGEQWRYATLQQAKDGHARALRRLGE